MNKILVATDFSTAAVNALEHACLIAKKAGFEITVLHVKNSHTKDLLSKVGKEPDELEIYMQELCDDASQKSGVACTPLIKEGSIFNDINAVTVDPDYKLLLIGTHGSKGLRQALFGADLLKIAKKSPVPVLATPDNAKVQHEYEKIVFPYGGHREFDNKIKAAGFIAKHFDAEIQLYTIERDNVELSKVTRQNIQKAQEHFDQNDIKHVSVHENMNDFSIGFANQTLEYTKRVGAQIISVMSTSSDEYSFISTVDKENLINNQDGISILLTGDY